MKVVRRRPNKTQELENLVTKTDLFNFAKKYGITLPENSDFYSLKFYLREQLTK
jgi:hypothetical protein